MRKDRKEHVGIQRLIEYYSRVFRTGENLDYYSPEDYRIAERKFVKYVLNGLEVPVRVED
jgi:hypothetical protein